MHLFPAHSLTVTGAPESLSSVSVIDFCEVPQPARSSITAGSAAADTAVTFLITMPPSAHIWGHCIWAEPS
jgi:hypothetical protein